MKLIREYKIIHNFYYTTVKTQCFNLMGTKQCLLQKYKVEKYF